MTTKVLEGQTAWITGSTRGIGLAIATRLAQAGAKVIISSRKPEACKEVAEHLQKQELDAIAIPCHTGQIEACDTALEQILKLGPLHILVNNAATNPYFGPIHQTPLSAFDKTFEVNVKGPFYLSCRVIQHMQEKNIAGNILNIASVNAKKPAQWQGVYSITKAAIMNMTQAFAKEVASSQIRVNALLPGFTQTDFTAPLVANAGIKTMILNQTPVNRMGQPHEIAEAAFFLVSPAASFITGACWNVDGGYLA
jgi:NAD(P)-dependent dehydrogenase (short-subunit alcohol dehydrogenase family)